MSASNKLRLLRKPAELKLAVRAAAVVLASPVLLKRYDIQKTVEILTPQKRAKPKKRLPPDRVIQLCHRVLDGFARVSRPTNCLRRNLLLYHCLRRHGTPVEINFGVKMGEGQLQGHCWLTTSEGLIEDREEMVEQFAPMFRLPRTEKNGVGDDVELWSTIERLDKLTFDE